MFELHTVLCDYDQTVSNYGTIDLYPNRILASTPELLNFEVLLEPLEEQFYAPTITVKFGDNECGEYKVVFQENECTVLLFVIIDDSSKRNRIIFRTFINGKLYG